MLYSNSNIFFKTVLIVRHSNSLCCMTIRSDPHPYPTPYMFSTSLQWSTAHSEAIHTLGEHNRLSLE